jgi:hypothetical protein
MTMALLLSTNIVSAQQYNTTFSITVTTAEMPTPSPVCNTTEIFGLKITLAISFIKNAAVYFNVSASSFSSGAGQTSKTGSRQLRGSEITPEDDQDGRLLGLIYKIYSGVGAFTCRLCPADNKDRRLVRLASVHRELSTFDPEDFEAYMSYEMTNNIRDYIKKKYAAGKTCMGRGNITEVDLEL